MSGCIINLWSEWSEMMKSKLRVKVIECKSSDQTLTTFYKNINIYSYISDQTLTTFYYRPTRPLTTLTISDHKKKPFFMDFLSFDLKLALTTLTTLTIKNRGVYILWEKRETVVGGKMHIIRTQTADVLQPFHQCIAFYLDHHDYGRIIDLFAAHTSITSEDVRNGSRRKCIAYVRKQIARILYENGVPGSTIAGLLGRKYPFAVREFYTKSWQERGINVDVTHYNIRSNTGGRFSALEGGISGWRFDVSRISFR